MAMPALDRSGTVTIGASVGAARLDSVDLVRGLVMVIMVLDHVRAYFTEVRFDPTDVTQTTLPLFLTRWVTHICAPTFIFLAGASAWIAGTRRTRGELARLLLSRGLWLLLLEFTVITFGWYFNLRMEYGLIAQVIWVIGASMIVLAGLIYLPRAAIAAIGLALVLGHNLFDAIAPERLGAWAPLWRMLHVPGPVEAAPVLLLYPLVPWVGVMALGYLMGPVVFSRMPGASRRLALLGVALIAAFVVLRALNGYGDPRPRIVDGEVLVLAMSFVNLTKYPPSLLFLLMTLGPALIALALAHRVRGPAARFLVVFGRVPFLFYVTHIYLVHALAVFAATRQGLPPTSMLIAPVRLPDGYGFGLPVIYLVWIGVVLLLYPLCARYARVKERSRTWWLSYL
ncbi:MAG: DUF1624 domain-containing protein [Gemmatimonadales bacterium]|nr:DUF1624 domain-containing protein [Gemmatimonadales bacterium]